MIAKVKTMPIFPNKNTDDEIEESLREYLKETREKEQEFFEKIIWKVPMLISMISAIAYYVLTAAKVVPTMINLPFLYDEEIYQVANFPIWTLFSMPTLIGIAIMQTLRQEEQIFRGDIISEAVWFGGGMSILFAILGSLISLLGIPFIMTMIATSFLAPFISGLSLTNALKDEKILSYFWFGSFVGLFPGILLLIFCGAGLGFTALALSVPIFLFGMATNRVIGNWLKS